MFILVTGGSGFIGSHLCKELLLAGNSVVCMDNNFTGSLGNIKGCLESSKFTYIDHDVVDPLNCVDHLEFDQIYHLACPASPIAYQLDPIKTIKTNVIGTMNIVEFARKQNKISGVLLTSTSEVYGDPNISPQTEDYKGNVNTFGPRACYDEGKRLAETLMYEYKNVHKIKIRIARIFNTYGPNMNQYDGRVISNFIRQCLNNENITIYGDGSQTRSFCYVSDMVDGLIKLMNSGFEQPINLGNPEEITITELAIRIKHQTGSLSTIIYKSLPQDDPMKRKPDITRAINKIQWYPIVNLEDGIKLMIANLPNENNLNRNDGN